jgi:hypothetical protein
VFDDTTAVAMFGRRYLFADIDQRTFNTTARANLSLSPRVSLQTFTQLLLAKGRYTSFKELSTPNTYAFGRYGRDIGTIAFMNGLYTFDPDGAGKAPSFSVPDPDFNFKSLRVNAVFRWEWKPGSTTYLVWTQTRDDGAKSTGSDLRDLFGAPSYNVFLVKISYWFAR